MIFERVDRRQPSAFLAGWGVRLSVDDAAGRIATCFSGRESVGFVEHQAERLLQERPKAISPGCVPSARRRRRSSLLHFPSVVLVDPPSQRIFIADTGHHRILICDLQGKCLERIGSGIASRRDGTFAQAAFSWPRGLSLDEDHLYVADTGNHLLRRCNLGKRIVSTVAGTGDQETTPRTIGPGALQGAVVRRAARAGVPVPITETLYAVLKLWERPPSP